MFYYQFDPATALYTGYAEAHESPEEPGVFMLPAFATFDPVPEFSPEGKIARRVNDAWVFVDLPPVIVPPVETEPGFDDIAAGLHNGLMMNMLSMAVALGFTSIEDAQSYGSDTSQKGYDSTDFTNWKKACESLFASFIASRNLPTLTELFVMLPKFVRRTYFPFTTIEHKTVVQTELFDINNPPVVPT